MKYIKQALKYIKIFFTLLSFTLLLITIAIIGQEGKAIALNIDGESTRVWGFSPNVKALLDSQNIELTSQDKVSPALDTPISQVTEIHVEYYRNISVNIDGEISTINTYKTTLAEVLSETKLPDLKNPKYSISLNEKLPRGNSILQISTEKNVTLYFAGKVEQLKTNAFNIQDFITERNIVLKEEWKTIPKSHEVLTENMNIFIGNIEERTEDKEENIPNEELQIEDSNLPQGTKHVEVKGSPGKKLISFRIISIDGKEVFRKETNSKVIAEAITGKTIIGTRKPEVASRGGGLDLRRLEIWEEIARCESSGKWNIDTGNGYYGGLQFNRSTWIGSGGGQYAPTANLATKEQQITIANRLADSRGFQPWPHCGRKFR